MIDSILLVDDEDLFHLVFEDACSILDITLSLEALSSSDEADALLIRRSSYFQAANKEFNRDVNFLLQKIEKTEVIVFLTTNYIENIDTAFFRRINYTIEFKKPGFQERKKLWELVIPAKLELDKNVDIEILAKKYKFTGGQIRQAVLNAVNNAFFMQKTKVSMQDFIQACDTIYGEDLLKGEKIGFLGVVK
jgi:ATP-dependent 26S proteasome regulatory subunit